MGSGDTDSHKPGSPAYESELSRKTSLLIRDLHAYRKEMNGSRVAASDYGLHVSVSIVMEMHALHHGAKVEAALRLTTGNIGSRLEFILQHLTPDNIAPTNKDMQLLLTLNSENPHYLAPLGQQWQEAVQNYQEHMDKAA